MDNFQDKECICHAHYESIERRLDGDKILVAPFDPICPIHGDEAEHKS